MVRAPDHVGDALALVDQVLARARGVECPTLLERRSGATWVPIDSGTGLGAGDITDLYLRVDL